MKQDDYANILASLLYWIFALLGYVIAVTTTVIQFLQLRHTVSQFDTKGSYIDCGTCQGMYTEEVTIQSSYLMPRLLRFTLRTLGIGDIQTAHVKPNLIQLVYYDKDGDAYEVPTGEWGTNSKGVWVNRHFLAEKCVQKLGIAAAQSFTPLEIQQKVQCRMVSDTPSGKNHLIIFEITNTNRIYELRNFRLELKEIPANCSEAQFVQASKNRTSKRDFSWERGSHPPLIIPVIEPRETINVTCKYSM